LTTAPATLSARCRHCCSSPRIVRLKLAISASVIEAFFYAVGMKNILDLFGSNSPSGGAESSGDPCGIFARVMDDFRQNIDDQQCICWRGRGGFERMKFSPCSNLNHCPFCVRTQVNIDIL
jgi:hypothetical protein